MKDLKKIILKQAGSEKGIKTSQLATLGGFSRVYANRILRGLEKSGEVIRIGKANKSTYFLPSKITKKLPNSIKKILHNYRLKEDLILKEIKNNTSIYKKILMNISDALDYSFTEILNNAIEHSKSHKINIEFKKQQQLINFVIRDFGVGVFKNIQNKFHLNGELEAINHLLKGKQTTLPSKHSGEGLFFTSKVADLFILESFGKRLLIDNRIKDIQITSIKPLRGTRVTFNISVKSKIKLKKIFTEYAGNSFKFSKTKVIVKLSIIDKKLLSRSQARRIVFGLDKFKEVIFDFKGVDSAGQAFCDEIFRVWQNKYKDIKIKIINANGIVKLMVNRAQLV